MAFSRKQGETIDRKFLGMLMGKSVLERGFRKAAGKVKKKVQQRKVDKARGFALKKQKYGEGTLTTKTLSSGEEKGKKIVTYKEKGVGEYSYAVTPEGEKTDYVVRLPKSYYRDHPKLPRQRGRGDTKALPPASRGRVDTRFDKIQQKLESDEPLTDDEFKYLKHKTNRAIKTSPNEERISLYKNMLTNAKTRRETEKARTTQTTEIAASSIPANEEVFIGGQPLTKENLDAIRKGMARESKARKRKKGKESQETQIEEASIPSPEVTEEKPQSEEATIFTEIPEAGLKDFGKDVVSSAKEAVEVVSSDESGYISIGGTGTTTKPSEPEVVQEVNPEPAVETPRPRINPDDPWAYQPDDSYDKEQAEADSAMIMEPLTRQQAKQEEPIIEAKPAKLEEAKDNTESTPGATSNIQSEPVPQDPKEEPVTLATLGTGVEREAIDIAPIALVDETPETSMAEDMGFSLPQPEPESKPETSQPQEKLAFDPLRIKEDIEREYLGKPAMGVEPVLSEPLSTPKEPADRGETPADALGSVAQGVTPDIKPVTSEPVVSESESVSVQEPVTQPEPQPVAEGLSDIFVRQPTLEIVETTKPEDSERANSESDLISSIKENWSPEKADQYRIDITKRLSEAYDAYQAGLISQEQYEREVDNVNVFNRSLNKAEEEMGVITQRSKDLAESLGEVIPPEVKVVQSTPAVESTLIASTAEPVETESVWDPSSIGKNIELVTPEPEVKTVEELPTPPEGFVRNPSGSISPIVEQPVTEEQIDELVGSVSIKQTEAKATEAEPVNSEQKEKLQRAPRQEQPAMESGHTLADLAKIEDEILGLQDYLDETKKGPSIKKLVKALSKLDEDVVDGIDDVHSAIEEYRNADRADKEDAFYGVLDSLEDLELNSDAQEFREEIKKAERKAEKARKKAEKQAALSEIPVSTPKPSDFEDRPVSGEKLEGSVTTVTKSKKSDKPDKALGEIPVTNKPREMLKVFYNQYDIEDSTPEIVAEYLKAPYETYQDWDKFDKWINETYSGVEPKLVKDLDDLRKYYYPEEIAFTSNLITSTESKPVAGTEKSRSDRPSGPQAISQMPTKLNEEQLKAKLSEPLSEPKAKKGKKKAPEKQVEEPVTGGSKGTEAKSKPLAEPDPYKIKRISYLSTAPHTIETKYKLYEGDKEVGRIHVEESHNKVVVTHREINPEYQGKQLEERLVRDTAEKISNQTGKPLAFADTESKESIKKEKGQDGPVIIKKTLSVKEAFSEPEPEVIKGSTAKKLRKPAVRKPVTLDTRTGPVRTIKGVGKTRRIKTGAII